MLVFLISNSALQEDPIQGAQNEKNFLSENVETAPKRNFGSDISYLFLSDNITSILKLQVQVQLQNLQSCQQRSANPPRELSSVTTA